MMLYLFLLLKTLILEIRFINIQPDTLTFTDLRPVEQISKKFPVGLKVLEYGIHYLTTSKTPRLLIFKRVIKPFLRVRQDATKYLNTLYLYFSLITLLYTRGTYIPKIQSFFFIFKFRLVFKLPVAGNLYS